MRERDEEEMIDVVVVVVAVVAVVANVGILRPGGASRWRFSEGDRRRKTAWKEGVQTLEARRGSWGGTGGGELFRLASGIGRGHGQRLHWRFKHAKVHQISPTTQREGTDGGLKSATSSININGSGAGGGTRVAERCDHY